MNYHQKNKDKILKKPMKNITMVVEKKRQMNIFKKNKEEIKKREREKYRNMDKFQKTIKQKKFG